jgi:hypothetical protein
MSAPRFYVVEMAGYVGVNGKRQAITASVLDRAYCHREVARFNEPGGTLPGERARRTNAASVAWVRENAAAEAARLNAWDASA